MPNQKIKSAKSRIGQIWKC